MLPSSTAEFRSRVVMRSSPTAHPESPLSIGDFELLKNGQVPKYSLKRSYGQSKLLNASVTDEIERLYGAQGLHPWSVHLRTGLQRLNMSEVVVLVKSGVMKTSNYLKSTG